MGKKALLWSFFTVCLLAIGIVQFIPGAPLVIPAELPVEQRDDHRLLNFEGIANFRDLGGYPTEDGRQVKWGVLYRSGTLAHSSGRRSRRSHATRARHTDRLPLVL